mmetsp:Transcript_3312/g.6536  ORF Transcript_3312/g.6536 Transcript_3312/m.6536 type:complete len:208 (-) Transcript_3312:170-793(-)
MVVTTVTSSTVTSRGVATPASTSACVRGSVTSTIRRRASATVQPCFWNSLLDFNLLPIEFDMVHLGQFIRRLLTIKSYEAESSRPARHSIRHNFRVDNCPKLAKEFLESCLSAILRDPPNKNLPCFLGRRSPRLLYLILRYRWLTIKYPSVQFQFLLQDFFYGLLFFEGHKPEAARLSSHFVSHDDAVRNFAKFRKESFETIIRGGP